MKNRFPDFDEYLSRQRFAHLVDDQVVPCSLEQWAIEGHPRRIALYEQGDYCVSTVFLGLDHGWMSARGIWFESMLFKGDDPIDSERYSSLDEALRGHATMVALLQSKLAGGNSFEAQELAQPNRHKHDRD
ncbi:MAG TPA: hypothetical protein VFO40_04920 [Chthoniobacterales bacterium]|nr:hypothetical protein [Chthoniobacterales bacterium]